MTPLRSIWAGIAAIAGFGLIAPAQAQNVSAANPASVASVIQGKGFTVKLEKDSDGDPLIRAEGNGAKFIVQFYGCTDGRDCQTITFYAGYTGSSVDVNKINEWNRAQRFGRAYIDNENDPVVEMDVDLDDGGMSRLLFEDNVEFWMTVMSGFSDFVFD